MNKTARGLLLSVPALGMLMLLSCSPARQTIRQPLKEEGPEHVFGLLKQNELQYEWLSARFSAKVSIDKEDIGLSGQVRIRRDSAIWVSLVPALGLEAARILITLDSVKFINRIENTYLLSDFSFINDHLNSGFDFDMLQAMILGNDLRYYENDIFKAGVDDKMYRLHTQGRRKLKKYIRNSSENLKMLVQSLWIDPENGKIRRVHVKEQGKENKKLDARYAVFEMIDNQRFPTQIEVDIEAEKNVSVRLSFSRVRINEAQGMPFAIPSGFERIRQK